MVLKIKDWGEAKREHEQSSFNLKQEAKKHGLEFVPSANLIKNSDFGKRNIEALQKASGVAGTEFVLKMILYYFHERIWYKSNFGLNDRKRKRS